jgi:hypothetical protein
MAVQNRLQAPFLAMQFIKCGIGSIQNAANQHLCREQQNNLRHVIAYHYPQFTVAAPSRFLTARFGHHFFDKRSADPFGVASRRNPCLYSQ